MDSGDFNNDQCRYASNIMLDVCAFMHVFEL